AHVKRPYTFTRIEDAKAAADSAEGNFCVDRAAQWIRDLEASCSITIPDLYKTFQMTPNLFEYCANQNGTHPRPFITADAVATDQYLIAATANLPGLYQLPQDCTLDRIARPTSPIAVANYTPVPGAEPKDVIKNVVDSAYQFPKLPAADMCRIG